MENGNGIEEKEKKSKPVTFKIEIKSPNTEYIWKELPNEFIDEADAKTFYSNIPRHVSHRLVKKTYEVVKEYNSDHAHYLS